MPDDRELLGKRLAGKVVIKPADEYNDGPYNEVSSVFESKTQAPVAGQREIAADPWGASAPAAAQVAPAAAQQPWGVTPEQAAASAPAAAAAPAWPGADAGQNKGF